jgi:hypothetical protein
MVEIFGKKSNGKQKALECGNGGELKIVLYATAAGGTLVPVKCDANGQLMTVAGT